MARAHDWYNLNSTRRYPLDTAATGDTDSGDSLPHDILLDCYVKFPRTVGEYAYLSSIYSSANLVSLTLLASDTPAAAASGCSAAGSSSSSAAEAAVFTPLAAISIPRASLVLNQQYALESLYPGVGGWVVFGQGLDTMPFSGKFSGTAQAMLAPRVARSYDPLPVPSMAKLHHATELTGLVQVRGINEIEVIKASRLISGDLTDALVIRLKDEFDSDGQSLLQKYTGPCAGRPESETCNKPVIEAINGVRPDCDGNIELEFPGGCVLAGQDEGASGGLVIDYCLGLAEACLDNLQPLVFDEQCLDSYGADEPITEPSDSLGIAPESAFGDCGGVFPYLETFEDDVANDFAIKSGGFNFPSSSSLFPVGDFKSTDKGKTNLAIWTGCDYHVRDKTAYVKLALLDDGGPYSNGGLVVGYREFGAAALPSFYLVEVDRPSASFRVQFLNEQGCCAAVSAAQPITLPYDTLFKIEVVTVDAGGGVTNITAKLYDGALTLATIAFSSTALHTDNKFGLHALRCETAFDTFSVT